MTDSNAKALNALHRKIRQCTICVDAPERKPLPHAPNPVVVLSCNAEIAICGQAPGNKVNQSGVPFTDPSGDRLRQWMGIDEQLFYDENKLAIIPMGFCFPGNDKNGGDLPPRPECRKRWHREIFEALPQLKLKLLVGASAQAWHLGKLREKSVTETVRNWRKLIKETEVDGIAQLPLPHPSWRNTGWIKKNPWFEEELLPELRQLVRKHMR